MSLNAVFSIEEKCLRWRVMRIRNLSVDSMALRFGVIDLVVSALFVSSCSALFFHIGETEKKCFSEDLPDDTLVVGERF